MRITKWFLICNGNQYSIEEVVFKMRTKKHIASTVLCCAALAVPISTLCMTALSASAYDYADIVDVSVTESNEYFSVKDGKLYTAKSGYFGVIAEFSDNVFTYVSQGYQMQSDSLESAVTELTGYGLAQYDSDGFVQTLNGEVKNLYILYGTDSSEVTAMYKMKTEGYTIETEPVAKPYFWVQPNKEKTEASTEGVVVYSVRARMGYDKMTSWDDVDVPDETLPHLERAVCKTHADEEGYSNWASVDGFDAGTYYDEFDVYFYANGTYTLSVTDTAGNYTYYELEVDGVGDNAVVENPYDGLDLTAPKLTIDVPSGKVPEGSVVKVKVTSDEPCVMLIGGECFGSTDNPVTEAVFEAAYNSRFDVVATDLHHNTTQTSFEVTNFDETLSPTNSNGEPMPDDKNPFDPSKRDTYWETANLSNDNIDGGNDGGNGGSNTGNLPQTGKDAPNDGVNVPLVAGSVSVGIAAVGGALYAFRKKIFKRGGAK